MSADYLKVRDDLQVQSEIVEDVNYHIIKEPNSGKFIRLREPEYYLLNQFDGSQTLDDICSNFQRTYNQQISTNALENFSNHLGKLGFFEGQKAAKPKSSKSLLYIKIKAFNPNKFLTNLYPKIKWLFSKPAIALEILIVILGGMIFFANISHFPYYLTDILSASSIIIIIISLFLLITTHEFAHAFACKRYGGKVNEMGFLLLYFQPCFYCNLSDAYLFKERRQRLIVMFAGLFFQMVVWGGTAILWRLTVEDYFLNRVFYLTSAVCFATLLFNLNPAIKLDGYYLLADYLRIPNLRQKAFSYLRNRIRGKLFGIKEDLQFPYTQRETKIFRRYGLLSIIYSTLLIVFILYRVGELLIETWQGTGFLLFLFLAFLMLKRLISKFAQEFASIWQERKQVWMKPKRLIIYLLLSVIIVIAAIFIKVEQTTGGSARLLAAESYQLIRISPYLLEGEYTRGGGVEERHSRLIQIKADDFSVTRITPFVSLGDSITTGDTLLKVSSTLSEGLLAEARYDLQRAEANRRLLLSDPKLDRIAQMSSEVSKTEALYESARQSFNRAKDLHKKELISDNDYESAKADFNVAFSAWEEKKSEFKLLKSGPKVEEVDKLDAEIEKLKSRKNYLLEQIEFSTIVAPFDGIIIAVDKKDQIFHLARIDSLFFELELAETDLDIISPGAATELRLSAFPARPYEGEVTKLKLSSGLKVIATIANSDGLLLPEMNGYAKVRCGSISIASLLTRKIGRFLRLEFWSWF